MVLENFLIDVDVLWDRAGKELYEKPEARAGRKMRVRVTNKGLVEDLTGYTLNLGWKSAVDETKFGLDAFTAVDITKGIFELPYTSGMLTNIGTLVAAFQLVPSVGAPTESNNFTITVKKSAVDAAAIQSENSFTALATALVEVTGWNARIDAVEADFIQRANDMEATYPQELLSLGSQLADIAINVKSFGAVGDGVTDDTVAIQNAHTSTLNGYVYLPPGNYKITSPIIYKKPMRGANKNKTSLYSYISDGSPVVLIDNIDYWELSDFVIRGQQKNCFGITAINDSSWYSMKNVDVWGCGLGGFDVEGWGGIIEDCHAIKNSGNGWTLRNANGVRANLHSDSNGGTGIVIESGGGLHLLSILSEGNKQGGLLINEAENIVLTCPYFEGNKKYQLKAGYGLNEIGELVIVGGKSTNTDKTNEGNFLFDKVNGLTVSKTLLNCQSNNPIETTANTKNVTMDLERPPYGFVHDSGISLNRSFNYMPNPFFDVWLSGYGRISHSSAVMSISKETTINKHGKQSLKVQSLPNTYGFISLGLPGKTLESLKGKKIGFGAWIYVPNISEFDIIERQPLIQIFNGTDRIGFNQSYLKKGRWNFVTSYTPLSIHEAVTSLVVEIYPHINTDSTATGNEFIIVDSIFVSECDSANYSSLMMGNLPDHNSLPTINNGNITNYGTAAPVNNAAMGKYVFNVGDRVINSVPVVGQPKSWVCTVASNGNVGTWVSEGIL